MTTRAMVVLSGGQDSTTCLFWAKANFDEVHAVTFDYNQRHRAEVDAAIKVAQLAGVASHEIVVVGPILAGRSPLTNPTEQLETYSDFASMDAIIGDRVELTFVPMRNQLFLTLAANRAVVLGIDNLVTGVCEADNANYPDCRGSFIVSLERTVNLSLGFDKVASNELAFRFNIYAPLLSHSKAASIALAQGLPGCMEALAYSHTCYAGEVPPCGKCHACVLRAEGFRQAGVPDPLVERHATHA